MPIITPEFIQNSFLIVLVSYGIAFVFQLYMAYLNWKQSKVNNQMSELIEEVKEIKKLIKNKKSR